MPDSQEEMTELVNTLSDLVDRLEILCPHSDRLTAAIRIVETDLPIAEEDE